MILAVASFRPLLLELCSLTFYNSMNEQREATKLDFDDMQHIG